MRSIHLPERRIYAEGDPDKMQALTLPNRQSVIDGRLLPELIDAYFEEKNATLGSRTERTYRDHLRPFEVFWNEHQDIHNQKISAEIMRRFHDWLRTEYKTSRGTRPAENTISHTLTVVKQIFEWMYRNDCTDGVPIQSWVPHVPLVTPDVYYPTTEELQFLLDTVSSYEGPWRIRDVAVVCFALSTGARASEITNAMVENLTFVNAPLEDVRLSQNHRGYVYLDKVKGDMTGEKNKGRYVIFGNEAGLLLKCWLRQSMRTTTIFNFQHGKAIWQMLDRHIQRVIKSVADGEYPGDATQFTAQSLRRAFSDNWDLKGGIKKRVPLKLQMGHSLKGDVTQEHYINTRNKKRIAQQLLEEHISPLEDLRIDWTKFPVSHDL